MAIILNPLFVFNIVSLIQFSVWGFFLPETGGLLNIAPKVVSEIALIRFLGLFFIANLGFCTYFLFDFFLAKPSSYKLGNNQTSIKWTKLAIFSCLIIIIADLFYVRDIVNNFSEVWVLAIETGRSLSIAQRANINKIWGLTTLNNLIPISVLFLFLSMTQNKGSRFTFFIWLFYLFLMSSLTSRRAIFAYSILGLIPVYYFNKKGTPLQCIISFSVTILFLFGLTIFLEFFRLGPIIASVYRINELWTLEGLFTVSRHWLQSYIATDFNNMLVILNNKPSLQLISSAPSLTSIVEQLFLFLGNKISFTGYSSIGEWRSGYGTVNFLGLLWYDFGYFSFLVTFFYTSIFSFFYSFYKRSFKSKQIGLWVVAYAIIYPGIYAISRVNFLFSVQFMVCFGFLAIIWIYRVILKLCSNQ